MIFFCSTQPRRHSQRDQKPHMRRKVVQSVSHIRFPSKECNEIWTLTNYWVKVLGIPMVQDATQYHVIDNYITISYINFCFSNKDYSLSIIDIGHNTEFWDLNSFTRPFRIWLEFLVILLSNGLFSTLFKEEPSS